MIMPSVRPERVTLSQLVIYTRCYAEQMAMERWHSAVAVRAAFVGGGAFKDYVDELMSLARGETPAAKQQEQGRVTAEQIASRSDRPGFDDLSEIEWHE